MSEEHQIPEREMEEEEQKGEELPWIRQIPPNLKPLLNKMIGNLNSFYQSLIKKGFYLPKRNSKAVYGEYLWKVFTNQVYCPLRSEVTIGQLKEKYSKVYILEILEDELSPTSVGLDEDHLPDMDWLVNVLHTFNPEHEVFKYKLAQTIEQNTQEKQLKQLLSGLDFTMAKGSRRSSIFKLSQQTKKKMTLHKKKLSLQRAKKSQQRMQKRILKQQKRITKQFDNIKKLQDEENDE